MTRIEKRAPLDGENGIDVLLIADAAKLVNCSHAAEVATAGTRYVWVAFLNATPIGCYATRQECDRAFKTAVGRR